MITLISCFTLGLIALPLGAQQFAPTVTSGNCYAAPNPAIFNAQRNYTGYQPTFQPNARPSVGIMPNSNNRQYGNYGNRQYNNGYSNNGQYRNYGNRQYNNGYSNNRQINNANSTNRQNYGNHQTGGNPRVTGWPTGGVGMTRGIAPVIPWWYTGRFNTALPHIRQQRPMPQQPYGFGNNYNQGGNRFPQPQYNNYGRPQQRGYQNGYQHPGNSNGYANGQRYRAIPTQSGFGVQPRVLR